jgi:hypothetical protein
MTEIATRAVIAFCALLVVWYVVGWRMNRKRGERLLEWILQGLRALSGDQITVSRLGTSGFQVNVAKAQVPFKTIEATILLEPREILLFWILNLLRGRGDYLVFKATLRAWPRGEIEVVRTGRLSRGVLEELDEKAWTCQETAGGGLSRRERPSAGGCHFAPAGRSQPSPAEVIAQQESPAPFGEPFPGWTEWAVGAPSLFLSEGLGPGCYAQRPLKTSLKSVRSGGFSRFGDD